MKKSAGRRGTGMCCSKSSQIIKMCVVLASETAQLWSLFLVTQSGEQMLLAFMWLWAHGRMRFSKRQLGVSYFCLTNMGSFWSLLEQVCSGLIFPIALPSLSIECNAKGGKQYSTSAVMNLAFCLKEIKDHVWELFLQDTTYYKMPKNVWIKKKKGTFLLNVHVTDANNS